MKTTEELNRIKAEYADLKKTYGADRGRTANGHRRTRNTPRNYNRRY